MPAWLHGARAQSPHTADSIEPRRSTVSVIMWLAVRVKPTERSAAAMQAPFTMSGGDRYVQLCGMSLNSGGGLVSRNG